MRLLSILAAMAFLATQACQTAAEPSASGSSAPFTEITFHTGPCFGSCPKISLHIDNQKHIEVTRQFFTGKMVPDTAYSGNFKGELSDTDYNRLLGLLAEIDWEKVDFPSVMCCDAPIRTLILTYRNKTHRFMSMTPPESTHDLIAYLTELAVSKGLPRFSGEIQFRNLSDSSGNR